jgi:hypothetical protein
MNRQQALDNAYGEFVRRGGVYESRVTADDLQVIVPDQRTQPSAEVIGAQRCVCIREDKSKHTVSIRPSPPDPFTDRHEHNHVFENSTPTYSVYKQGILFASVRCCIRLSTEKLVGAPQPIISARKR